MRKRKYGILSLNVFSTGISWSYCVKDRVGVVGEISIDFRDRTYKKLIITREFILKILQEYKPSHVVIGQTFYSTKPNILQAVYSVVGVLIDRCLSSTSAKPFILNDRPLLNYFDVNSKSGLYDFIIDIYGWEDKNLIYESHKNMINTVAQSVYYFEKIIGGHGKKNREYKDSESLNDKFVYFYEEDI